MTETHADSDINVIERPPPKIQYLRTTGVVVVAASNFKIADQFPGRYR